MKYLFCHFFFLNIYLFLHHLENRTKPISTPHDGRCWWDSNLHTFACESPNYSTILCNTSSMCVLHIDVNTVDIQ